MAPASILFSMGMPKSIGSILIDAFIDEDHHSQVTVTTSPVEDGTTISDNAVEEPEELTVTGICGAASLLTPVASIASIVSGGASLQSFVSRPLDVDQALLQLKSARLPVIVVTGLRVYQNMIIADYRVRRDSRTGAALVFTIQFHQIQIVQSQTARVPAAQIGGGAGHQVQDTLGTGNQPTIQPPVPIRTTVKADLINNFNLGMQGLPGQGTF
jgi:hypothetical protein